MRSTPARMRQFLKWAGLAGLACLLVIWLHSTRRYLGYVDSTSSLSVSYGSLCYRSIHEESPGDAQLYRSYAGLARSTPTSKWIVQPIKVPGFHYRGTFYLQMNDKISIPFDFITRGTGQVSVFTCAVPLWFIFLIFAVMTALLWFHHPRIQPGHCHICNYDLTGNTSGICSECGTLIPKEEERSGPIAEPPK